MDVYWSIERCGWVPCRGAMDPLATTWSDPARESEQAPDVPLQPVPLPSLAKPVLDPPVAVRP